MFRCYQHPRLTVLAARRSTHTSCLSPRLGVAPFARARDLLAPLPVKSEPGQSDLLQMCHQLAAEVVALGGGRRYDVPLDMLHELMPQNGVKREVTVKKEQDEEEVDAFEVSCNGG